MFLPLLLALQTPPVFSGEGGTAHSLALALRPPFHPQVAPGQSPGTASVVMKVDPEKTPAAVVSRYVAAHNAKDLQALLATVDLDVKLAVLPDQVQLKGKADFASAMRESFAAMPDVKLEVTERMLAGTRVIDHHWTKGLPEGRLVRGITIYEVRNGVIVGMWFAQD